MRKMKRLFRTQDDRKLAGICGGVARYFSIDPTLVRLVFLVLVLVTGVFPILIGYILAIFVIPNEQDIRE